MTDAEIYGLTARMRNFSQCSFHEPVGAIYNDSPTTIVGETHVTINISIGENSRVTDDQGRLTELGTTLALLADIVRRGEHRHVADQPRQRVFGESLRGLVRGTRTAITAGWSGRKAAMIEYVKGTDDGIQ